MEDIYNQKPWVRGLVETLTAIGLIRNSTIETKNRQALVLLDSVLEIGFKNFILYEKNIKLDKNNPILQYRDKLHAMIRNQTKGLFSGDGYEEKDVWKLIDFYYEARCDLYHEMAEKTLLDSDIKGFYKLVCFVLDKMFTITTADLVKRPEDVTPSSGQDLISVAKLRKPIELFLVAVAHSQSKNPKDVKQALKRLGTRRKFDASRIGTYLFGASYGHLFHRNEDSGIIELSEQGRIQYNKLRDLISAT